MTFIRGDGRTEIRFGETEFDEEIIPNPNNVGSSLHVGESYILRYLF